MNNYAISSDGIATALQDSASALMEAGNTLEQSVALVASANKVVQDPNSVGSALRTISLRLRGTSVKVLEEMGEETDGVVESVSKMQSKIEALTGVNILTDSGAYKETYTILQEIGQVWEDMSDIDQAALLELMAGKNRANTLAAILGNMEDLENAYKDALGAEGSALKENAAYLDSIQGRIDLFNNSLQTMWMNLLNTDIIKDIVDIGTGLIKFLDSTAGRITALGVALGILDKFLKIGPAFSVVNNQFQILGKTTETIRNNFTQLSAESTGLFSKISSGFKSIFGPSDVGIDLSGLLSEDDFNTKIHTLINGFNNLDKSVANITWDDYVNGLSNVDDATKAALKTCTEQNGVVAAGTGAYQTYTGAATSAAVGTSAVGGAAQITTAKLIGMKVAAFAANAALTLGLSLVISLAAQCISAWANAGEAARKAAQDAANASEELREQNESLKDYKKQIRELRKELDSNTLSESEAYTAREKLLTIQNELIDKFGLEKDGINLVTGAIEAQISAIDKLSQKDAQQWLNNNQQSINEAIAYFDSDTQGGLLDSELFGLDKKTTITNWGSTQTVSDMISEYAKDRQHIETLTINGVGQDISFTGSVEEVKQEIEDFQVWLDAKETELNTTLASLTSIPLSQQTQSDKDHIESLKKDILQLKDIREDIGTEYTNWFGENSTYSINKALLEEAQYNTAITKYADQYADILAAQTKLAEAQAKDDQDGIKSALAAINAETTAAAASAEKNGESYMVSFFNGIKDGYAKLSSEIKLEKDIIDNITFGMAGSHLADTISNILSKLDGMNAKEILQLEQIDPHNSAFVELRQIAHSYGVEIEDLCNILVKLGYIQSGFNEDVASSINPIKTYSTLITDVESYNDVLSQTSEIVADNTEVTQEYKDSLTALGLSQEELADCFDENNGLIVKNAALLNKLVKQKKQDKQATIQQAKAYGQLQYKNTINQISQLINSMATEIKATGYVSAATLDNISVLRQQLTVIKETIQQYALLELSLSDAAQAYSDFEEAKTRDAQLTYGDSMVDALNVLNEGFKTGQVGSDAFQYAVKLIVPPEFYEDIEDAQERMQAIHDYVDQHPIFADWFTIDEGQISITIDNIKAFIQDGLTGVDGKPPAFIGTLEDFDLSSSIQSVEDLATALGTTEAVTLAMLTEFEKYDASWGDIVARLTTTELDRNIEDATTALEEAINAQERFIRDGKQLYDENGNYTKEYQAIVDEVTGAYNRLSVATKEAVDNASTFTQIETLLQGLTGELKLSQEQADHLARSLGLIGEGQSVTILDDGTIQLTQNQIDILNAKLTGLKEPTILDIQLASDEIDRQIQELQNKLDGKDYDQNVLVELEMTETDDIQAKINELTATQRAIELVYNITPSNEQNDSNLEKLGEWEANGVNITVRADTTEFNADMETVNAAEIPEKNVPITTTAAEANEEIGTVTNNNPPDKNVNISMQGVSVALNDIASISDALDSLSGFSYHTVIVRYDNQNSGVGSADGNFHISGGAFASGTVGAPNTEMSLMGELGPELIVDPSTGRWHTVGDHGAEFTQVKRGQIIFNHLQTKQLLENGYITSRGRLQGGNSAFASGTAYGFGIYDSYVGDNDAFANGSDKWVNPGENAWSDAADSVSDAADNAEEVVDFIEMKLEEIEAIIEKTSAKIANFLDDTTSIKSKDELYDELVKAEKDKSEAYLKAAQKYNVQAAAALSGVPQQYQEMARNGAIAIEDFIGEDQVEIAEKIQEYRDWAAKADEAENGHLEAIAAISAHRVEQLEDIATDFENIVSISKSHSDLLQAEMDFIEESGNRLSENYYEELKRHSQKQLDDMQAERVALQKILDDSVAAGDVVIGSDDWYSMLETIYEVDKEIVDCKTSLEEFQNAINELYWDNFEKLIDEIDNVDSELSNLYDLISDDDKVVDEMGNWTDEGVTALGLLAQQMEVAQQKSKEYGKAIDKLKKDYAAGLYSTDEYNEKLSELTESQYDAIKSYEDAKNAIVDLNKTRIEAVKEGIQKEIDAYSELIEKKKESLNSDKEAYDFQKQVEKSNKNIEDIERKIAALQGDTSSSAMAQRKRLEAELLKAKEEQQDMYYDHSIEKQQEALDKELEGYTKNKEDEMNALDEYLKKEEQVISDSFDLIAENTRNIANTLIGISEEYGVSISDTVATPWINGTNAIGTYQEQLNTSVSATTKNLETLKQHLEDLQTQADKTAESVVAATHSTVVTTNDGHQTSIKGYAKGTTSVPKSGLYNLDELGPELVLHAGKNGKLEYLTMDSAVIPADLTQKLMQWGQLDPSQVLERSASQIGMPNIANTNNNMEINLQIAEVVHIDHADNGSIPDIAKAVKVQMDSYMRDINNKLRRK